jgi:shikimate dehydrogenase
MCGELPPCRGRPWYWARAVVNALADSGWQVTVAARRLAQAQALVRDLQSGGGVLRAAPLNEGVFRLPAALIVNTTPVGMHPNPADSVWPAAVPFPRGAAVYDLVYNPPQTALVQAARTAGLAALGGLGMLVEQAALAFEIWTGQPAPREAMWKALQPTQEES